MSEGMPGGRAITELGREVYELRGELKGRDLIAGS